MLETELRMALERKQLHLAYQPQVDLGSGETVAVEALLRWDHPAMGSVSPAAFIPVAEETGLIISIGRFVLEEASRQAAIWESEGFRVGVSVNVSGRQIVETTFVAEVTAALTETGLSPDLLCLELTESVLMSDTARIATTLRALHAIGVTLSIDDFGTGYSSLAYLHRFPVDELKIDRAFIRELPERPDQRVLVTAMVAMGKAFGLRIVAEGVETSAQAQAVAELGCHAAQGFLYARPQSANEVEAMLRAALVSLRGRSGR
jgi:EAL domain-containing protein (putative c-di-GMP-specific phosphodiesterase class I)